MRVGRDADVIVVGAGNAGFCAARAAAERGARVLVLEKAPDEWRGGNSFFTAGAIRTAHGGLDDAGRRWSSRRAPGSDRRSSPTRRRTSAADLERVTEGRCDPELAALARRARARAAGLAARQGIRWRLMYDRQAYEADGRQVVLGRAARSAPSTAARG